MSSSRPVFWNSLREMANGSHPINPLVAIKFLHTLVWAFLAGCILALPIAALLQRFNAAMILTAIIVAECGVLALIKGKCPLTGLAARFTALKRQTTSIFICQTGWHGTTRQSSAHFSSSTNCSCCGAG